MVRIVTLAGDGIGPEVTSIALRLLSAYRQKGLELHVEEISANADRYLAHGVILTDAEWALICGADAILVGAFGDRRVPGNEHAAGILLRMRRELNLHANIRSCIALSDRLIPLARKSRNDVCFWVFRENTEGAYAGMGSTHRRALPDEMAMEVDLATMASTERIVRDAFEFANKHGLPSVCMADKSNAQPHVGGVWQRAFVKVQRDFPKIRAFHMYADALCDRIVREPEAFSVIVTNNLFGDLLSDLGASLSGGMGLAPSLNRGKRGPVLVEPVHGTAPDIAGKGIANPMASLRCVGMLLDHFGVSHSIDRVIAEMLDAKECTPDVGGTLSTEQVWSAFYERWERG